MGGISGRQLDSVQKETLAVSATETINRPNRPLLLQKRTHRLTEEDLRQDFSSEKIALEGMVKKVQESPERKL